MTKYFSKTHEWVDIDGDEATVGVSAYATKELGDITYVELPKEGADVIVGPRCCRIRESGFRCVFPDQRNHHCDQQESG